MIQLYFVQFKYPGEGSTAPWHTLSGSDGHRWKGGRDRAVDMATKKGNDHDGYRFRIKPVRTIRRDS